MFTLYEGLLSLPLWGYIAVTLVLTHITIASVTIFLHRHQSHHALTLHPLVSHFFRFWLWLTTGMVTKQWVAIHRKHHAKCETDEDPHSPQIVGIRKVLFEGTELYRKEAANQETMQRYGQGTPDDWLERRLYSRYPFLGISLLVLLQFILFGAAGVAIFAFQMLWIPFWAAGVINGIGHYWGYRNFETVDASRNIAPWGILIGGEELHNNHHAYAASAKLSNKWWEFDIGWLYIRMLELLRLAKVKRKAPTSTIDSAKQVVDGETVHAVVRNRFHIMKVYGRKVLRPVLREARRGADSDVRQLFRRARKLLTREDVKLDGSAQATLNEALQKNINLETVYRFKQQLKQLWLQTSNNQANRVQSLQAWCSAAEKTGIRVLQDFAVYLRGYTLRNV